MQANDTPMDNRNPHEDRRCGAKTRGGTPCQRRPVAGSKRCRLHGGRTPRGEALPQFKHGRYSKSLPSRLTARYQEAMNDPELLNLRAEVALVDTLLADRLAALDTGGGSAVFKELVTTWKQLLRLQAAGRTKEAGVVLTEIGQLIDAGHQHAGVLEDIARLIDQRRKLVDSEQRRLVAMQQMLTTEQAMTFVSVVMGAVKAHVSDRDALAAISAEIERHALNAGDGHLDA